MPTTTDDIVERLRAELQEAREKLATFTDEATHPPEVELGGGSDGYSTWQTAVVLKSQFEDHIAELEEAMARVEAGTYGFCDYCGKPIPAERLEAVPFTGHCVPCASVAHPHESREQPPAT